MSYWYTGCYPAPCPDPPDWQMRSDSAAVSGRNYGGGASLLSLGHPCLALEPSPVTSPTPSTNYLREASSLSIDDARVILALRLLIARAANSDSLAWWEDEALTLPGAFVLEKVFPVAPPLAARNLALHAALARHQAACPGSRALHLYRLDRDNQDGLALRRVSSLSVDIAGSPITSIAALEDTVRALIGGPFRYRALRRTPSNGLEIEIPPPPTGVSPLLHRARSLAWAYLEGAPRAPVFPFCTE